MPLLLPNPEDRFSHVEAQLSSTVSSEIFVSAKFHENKTLTIWPNHTVFTDVGKSCSLDKERHLFDKQSDSLSCDIEYQQE